jgi:hypothetical protein
MNMQDVVAFGTLSPHTHNELPIPKQLSESAEVGNSTVQRLPGLGSFVDFLPSFEGHKPGEFTLPQEEKQS